MLSIAALTKATRTATMFTIRPYTDADYDAFVRIDTATQSTAFWSEADWQPIHPPRPATAEANRYVAVHASSAQVVGYGAILLTSPSNLDVLVDPSWQRRGVGTQLWERMQQDLAPLRPLIVGPWVRAANTAACQWMTSLGFEHVDKEGRVQLAVPDADLSPLASATQRLAAQGIALTTLAAEQKQTPDCLTHLHHLYQEAEKDVPGYNATTPTSYDDFLQALAMPGVVPESVFLATHQSEYVGFSILGRRLDPDDVRFAGGEGTMSQHLTGVHPNYRRRGIARALKLCTIQYARLHNSPRILTASDNPAMRALNWELGFRTGPWYVYQKALG